MLQRIKVGKYFFLDEFVDPFTYFNEKDNGFSKLDKRLFEIADLLREKYGSSISINNWWSFYLQNSDKPLDWIVMKIEESKLSKWSGYRSTRCKIGAKASAHRLGKAIDPKGNEKEFFEIVKNNLKEFHALGVRRLEDISITKGWLHIDTHLLNVVPGTVRVVDLKRETQRLIVK